MREGGKGKRHVPETGEEKLGGVETACSHRLGIRGGREALLTGDGSDAEGEEEETTSAGHLRKGSEPETRLVPSPSPLISPFP